MLRLLPAALAASALAASFATHAAPTGCDDLSSVPITEGVDFDTQIRPLIAGAMSTYSCADCHQPNSPNGGLDLMETSNSPPAIEALAQRITERRPRESLFFNKINCADPDFGSRMPLAGSPLPIEVQALVYDWIAQGARGTNPDGNEVSDTVFRSGLESMRID